MTDDKFYYGSDIPLEDISIEEYIPECIESCNMKEEVLSMEFEEESFDKYFKRTQTMLKYVAKLEKKINEIEALKIPIQKEIDSVKLTLKQEMCKLIEYTKIEIDGSN